MSTELNLVQEWDKTFKKNDYSKCCSYRFI